MKLTKEQLDNLLAQAYGFMCKYLTLMLVDTYDEEHFKLANADAEYASCLYEGAELDFATGELVVHMLHNPDAVERFKILIAAEGEETIRQLISKP